MAASFARERRPAEEKREKGGERGGSKRASSARRRVSSARWGVGSARKGANSRESGSSARDRCKVHELFPPRRQPATGPAWSEAKAIYWTAGRVTSSLDSPEHEANNDGTEPQHGRTLDNRNTPPPDRQPSRRR